MKRFFSRPLSLAALTLVFAQGASWCAAEPGVLLVAHGSRDPAWNQPVLDFGRQVAAHIKTGARVKEVRTALMESAQPDTASALAELEAAGCDRIVAVPLFVAPSGHTHFDVPAVLGVYASPRTTTALAGEGTRIARPRVPVILTPTLAEGTVLDDYAVQQVRKLSQSAKDEAIVILAHGDPEHELLVDRKMRQIVTRCCGEAGISYGDWAYIGVGQEYARHGVTAIQTALEARKRVLVVGLYLSLSAAKIRDRHAAAAGHGGRRSDPLQGQDVVFSEEPLLTFPGLKDWVAQAAKAAVDTTSPPASAQRGAGESR